MNNLNRILWIISLVTVLASIIVGLNLTGGPTHQRLLRKDEERLKALDSLQISIDEYYRENNKLPISLKTLTEKSSTIILKDPSTGKIFDYEILENTKYKLCTSFEFSYNEKELRNAYYPLDKDIWKNYKKGYHCFILKAPTLQNNVRIK